MKNKANNKSSRKSQSKSSTPPSTELVRKPGEPDTEQSPSPDAANSHPPAPVAPSPGLTVNTTPNPTPPKPEQPETSGQADPEPLNGLPSAPLNGSVAPLPQSYLHPRGDTFPNVDRLTIWGGPDKSSYLALLINERLLLELAPKEWVAVQHLLCHSHSRGGLPSEFSVGKNMFLSGDEIVANIKHLMPRMHLAWAAYSWDKEIIQRIICDLKRRIAERDGNSNIIQSAGMPGYRFSVPPTHIRHYRT